ncbi:MAG: RNA polymerase sigma factor [Thermoguttaceae bacterium]
MSNSPTRKTDENHEIPHDNAENVVKSSVFQESGLSDADFLRSEFEKIESELMGTLFFMLGNSEDAKDAVQEAFLRCWKNRDMLDSLRNTRAWIFRIATNLARDMRKSAWSRKRKEMPDNYELEDKLHSRELSPVEKCEKNEQLETVRQKISLMEETEKEIFLLRQNGDMTYEQIAEFLEMPIGTVKTKMRKIIMVLRETV